MGAFGVNSFEFGRCVCGRVGRCGVAESIWWVGGRVGLWRWSLVVLHIPRIRLLCGLGRCRFRLLSLRFRVADFEMATTPNVETRST